MMNTKCYNAKVLKIEKILYKILIQKHIISFELIVYSNSEVIQSKIHDENEVNSS